MYYQAPEGAETSGTLNATVPNASVAFNVKGSLLVGDWELDENGGTVAHDTSGFGNDGVIYGNPAWGTGYNGKPAMVMNATVQDVEMPAKPTLNFGTKAMSVTAWVKLKDGTSLTEATGNTVIFQGAFGSPTGITHLNLWLFRFFSGWKSTSGGWLNAPLRSRKNPA